MSAPKRRAIAIAALAVAALFGAAAPASATTSRDLGNGCRATAYSPILRSGSVEGVSSVSCNAVRRKIWTTVVLYRSGQYWNTEVARSSSTSYTVSSQYNVTRAACTAGAYFVEVFVTVDDTYLGKVTDGVYGVTC